MKAQFKRWSSLAILAALAAGCQGKSDPPPTFGDHALELERKLEAESGQSISIQKLVTHVNGFVVYRNDVTGEFFAYNVSKFSPGMSLTDYRAGISAGDFVGGLVGNLETITYPNPDYDPTDIFRQFEPPTLQYDVIIYRGSGYAFTQGTPYLKDLEAMGAALEATDASTLGASLEAQYGLSETRSMEIARLMMNWSALSRSRSMTPADLAVFSKEILGVDPMELETAREKAALGDKSQIEDLYSKAAEQNDITPEHARRILSTFLN